MGMVHHCAALHHGGDVHHRAGAHLLQGPGVRVCSLMTYHNSLVYPIAYAWVSRLAGGVTAEEGGEGGESRTGGG